MSKSQDSQTSLQDCLSGAARWRLLSLLFQRPAPGWFEEVNSLAGELHDPALQQIVGETRDTSEGAYLALLGPGGPVSPREAAYRGLQDPAAILADLNAFYEAFGFSPRTEEPPDHISNEISFVAYLRTKEAFARLSGAQERLAVTNDSLEKFVNCHLEGFVEPFTERLRLTGNSYFGSAASLLQTEFERLTASCQPLRSHSGRRADGR